MEITGKMIKMLPEVMGETSRGTWVRSGFVVEVGDDYPKKVCFTCIGEDKIAMAKKIPDGSMVMVSFQPESREYNGKWYTELKCSSVKELVVRG